jgi:hypothetical protein
MCAAGLFEGARRASTNGHVSAFAGQFFRNRAAKPFAGGRDDDGYAASEP